MQSQDMNTDTDHEAFGTVRPDRFPRPWFTEPFSDESSVAWMYCTDCGTHELNEKQLKLALQLVNGNPSQLPAGQYLLSIDGCPVCKEATDAFKVFIDTPEDFPADEVDEPSDEQA